MGHLAQTFAGFGLVMTATVALAQVPPAELGQRFVPAPWWMRDPVVASLGQVRTEVAANRAAFEVRFSVVEKTTAAATGNAAKRAQALDQSLRALGAERVRLTTTFGTRPLYDQYRQKDGTLVDNQRADHIDAYEVTATLQVSVRDVEVLERAYRMAVAARPTAIGQVSFALEPTNTLKTWLATEAVADAAKRAHAAVTAGGGRLGPPKVIDPSGGVCNTQVLAGWPSYVGGSYPTDVEAPRGVVMAGSRMVMASPPAPMPSLDQQADDVQVTLQPPLRELSDRACIVFGLLP